MSGEISRFFCKKCRNILKCGKISIVIPGHGAHRIIFHCLNPKLLTILPFAFYDKEMFGLIFILGLIGIIRGVYLVAGPADQINRLMEWWYQEAGDGTIRLFGLIAFILGCAIFSYLMY